MNMFEKMAAITAELGVVAKNLEVTTGKNSYKAVGERDILDAVKPIEAKYKVYSYPVNRDTLESEQLESTTKDGSMRTTFYTRIKTTYRFVNIEDPIDYIDTVVFSVGMDSQDKGDGKAMTYADKYALMKAYKISTGDDPDQEGSEEHGYKRKKTSFEDTSMKQAPNNPSEVFIPTCSVCKKEITTAEHDWSVKRYKKPLCREHQREADKR